MLTPEELEKAEQAADIGGLPTYNDNEILMELAVGSFLDCRIITMQAPRGKMESSLLHGVTVKQVENGKLVDDVPMKMWAGAVLARIFEDEKLMRINVRIRRMSDQDFTGGRGKMFRVSDLVKVLALTSKDRAVKV